jgi:hypothetical protein
LDLRRVAERSARLDSGEERGASASVTAVLRG